jgi:thymidine kinase
MKRAGSVHVITGCMFSGKTEELLRQLRRASVGGRSVLLVRPAADTRSSSEIAESRSGASFACITIRPAHDIYAAVAASPCEVVAIDEAEMFDDQLADVAEGLASDGYEVIVSGLDTDFAGRPFGAMPTLLAQADSVAKLTAICTFPGCGAEATRTQRLVNNQPAAVDDPLIVIGGTEDRREPDRYEARCRTHHRVAPARHTKPIAISSAASTAA